MADKIITIAKDTDRANMKAAYQKAVSDLSAYRTKKQWTNAEAVAAIKRMAGIQEYILKFLARLVNG